MWLLEAMVRQALERAHKAGFVPSAEQITNLEARHTAAASDSSSRILTVAGNSAEIEIKGVLTKSPSFMAMIFGGGNTTYAEIVTALAEAAADTSITDITLSIDSPGGSIDGLFDALAAIQSTNKPIKAVVLNMAASAAFAIASQADTIVATNQMSRVGSIGIAATFDIDPDTVTITSDAAPKKRPDVTTQEGQAMVKEELNAMHEIFVDAIANGRRTTMEKVNAEFGQGATVLAGEALKRGMIDGVERTSLHIVANSDSTTTAQKSGNNSEVGPMDINTLKASHPDVYQAAVKDGITQERDRATAHLTMGAASGDMKTAIAAVGDGAEMTATLQAKYMSAGMNRKDSADRQDDDTDASAADNANSDDDKGDSAEDVTALVEAQLGIEAEA